MSEQAAPPHECCLLCGKRGVVDENGVCLACHEKLNQENKDIWAESNE